MRVEVAIRAEESSETLEIPWESSDPEVRYFDLRGDPRAIARIDAARQHPPLGSFLVAVNSEDSVFATTRCKTWLQQVAAASGAEACEFGSRIDLVFAPEPFNFQRSRYDNLTQRLQELLSRETAPDALRSELSVRPCRFHATARLGFCLRILLRARGATSEQVELRWGLGLARIQQALLFISRIVRQQIAQVS
jgi:hypothetical protein